MSRFEDEENQEVEIPEGDELIEIPDIDLDLDDGEFPMLDEDELE